MLSLIGTGASLIAKTFAPVLTISNWTNLVWAFTVSFLFDPMVRKMPGRTYLGSTIKLTISRCIPFRRVVQALLGAIEKVILLRIGGVYFVAVRNDMF